MEKMYKNVRSRKVAEILKLECSGNDMNIKGVCSADSPVAHSLTFAKNRMILARILKSEVRPLAIITTGHCIDAVKKKDAENICFIASAMPALSFIKAYDIIYPDKNGAGPEKSYIHPSAVIESKVSLGKSCRVLANVYIGPDTEIGDRVVLHPGVTIYGNTIIGNDVIIHSGTVVAKSGLGYEKDENGDWIRFPYVGKVIIGDNVEIGSCVVIGRGALGDTVVGSGTKLSNLVNVSHDVKIGRNCILVAGCFLGGHDIIGDDSWIGPNSSLIDRITVGNRCVTGVGSVVVRDIPDDNTVVGNPAVPVAEYKKMRKALKRLIP